MTHTRTTMTRDSTSHRIFKISELTRLITSHIPRLKSAVNLACACRYLEEPVLSTLWEKQNSLNVLLEVLPRETWGYTQVGTGERTVCGLGLRLEKTNAQAQDVLDLDRRGPAARGVEQGPAVCGLDAPSLRGRVVVGPWG